jgi:hypothetical protein
MKIPSLLSRLKLVKKYPQRTRFIVVLVPVAVLLVSTVSVAAYRISVQKIKPPVAERAQSKPPTPAPKVDPKPTAVAQEDPAGTDNTPPPPVPAGKPLVKQATKPRPHTSEDPAYVVCVQKYSDLYVKYNADIESINAEKNLALATIDELYNSGFYAETYPGDTEPYNQWQIDRAELAADYNDQLADLNSTYATNSSAYLNC